MDNLIENEVRCSRRGANLMVITSSAKGRPVEDFFTIDCPTCRQAIAAVRLVGETVEDYYPKP